MSFLIWLCNSGFLRLSAHNSSGFFRPALLVEGASWLTSGSSCPNLEWKSLWCLVGLWGGLKVAFCPLFFPQTFLLPFVACPVSLAALSCWLQDSLYGGNKLDPLPLVSWPSRPWPTPFGSASTHRWHWWVLEATDDPQGLEVKEAHTISILQDLISR